MTRPARTMLARLAAIALTLTAVGLGPSALVGAAHAAPGDIGFEDYQYGPGMSSDGFLDPNLAPTASKPQSKLWFAQGAWWGALQVPGTTTITIHAYSTSTHTWTDTGVVIDDRDEPTHADVLWDEGGQRLYVATAGRNQSVHGIRVLRFRYDATQKKYLDDPGLPTGELTTQGVEAAVIAKDTTGRLWVAYTASAGTGRAVRVLAIDTHQTGLPDKFTPSVGGIPLDGTSITKDDIASIISHDGGVSLVWSNQNADAEGNTGFFVARHPDSAAPTDGWTGSQKVFSGPRVADDHISLTSAEGGPDGLVYAMVKSSAGDSGTASPNEGLVWLLVRRPDGTWAKYVHSTVKEGMTRPIVLLEPGAGLLHVFATSPVEGGVIYHKSTPMNAISFGSGRGDAFIKLANHPAINNATSSKQNVTAASGVMVLASDQTTGNYAHNYVPRTASSADFTWTPQSGPAPLEVRFTDTSAVTGGAPTSWLWDFGDGATSTQQHPTHTFTTQGAYPVTLTVTNAAGSTSKTLTLTVNVAKPVASFTYTPQSGRAPLEVRFTDTSAATGGAPASWLWNFGDGTTSTQQHPTHTFAVGAATRSVRVENLSGTSTVQKTITIALHPETPVVVLDAATVVTTGPPGVDGTWHTSTERTEVAGYEVRVPHDQAVAPGAVEKPDRPHHEAGGARVR